MKHKYAFHKSAGEKAFWTCDGKKIDSIKEIYEQLDNLSDDVFKYHVNTDKNDFSQWIRDVFNENTLSSEISKLSSKKEIKVAIRDWISDEIYESHKKNPAHQSEPGVKPQNGGTGDEAGISIFSKKSTADREDLEGLDKPAHFLAGIIDFLLGFIIGALSMILMSKLI